MLFYHIERFNAVLIPSKNSKIIVGMSGGVDSSVAALLLVQQGYTVEGLFMKNWEDDDENGYCAATEDAQDAKAVCGALNIPFHTVNFSRDYWDHVFKYFLAEYQAGRTPNPDILCNKEIKFKAFLNYAKTELSADEIATGHYVRKHIENGHAKLLCGLDENKDQSYFLYALDQAQLVPALFPIGDLKKTKVRQLAKTAGFHNYAKKDSTGICFIGERKFKTFLQEYLPAKPGAIESIEGDVIGQHDGLMYHTMGQRQGLNVGGRQKGSGEAWYVVDKDLNRNVLIAAQGKDHPRLFSSKLLCEQVHWIAGAAPDFNQTYTAKIRYRQTAQSCKIIRHKDKLCVEFSKPQRGISPGQAIVFYDGEVCLGGGVITEDIND